MKSERYDTEEESSRLGFEKSARGGGWVVLEADFKGDAADRELGVTCSDRVWRRNHSSRFLVESFRQ